MASLKIDSQEGVYTQAGTTPADPSLGLGYSSIAAASFDEDLTFTFSGIRAPVWRFHELILFSRPFENDVPLTDAYADASLGTVSLSDTDMYDHGPML